MNQYNKKLDEFTTDEIKSIRKQLDQKRYISTSSESRAYEIVYKYKVLEGTPQRTPESSFIQTNGYILFKTFNNDSGYNLEASTQTTLEPGQWANIDTPITIHKWPPGYEIQIRPRSSLAIKYGVTVLNSPGTIDEDYCGPIKVCLINHGRYPYVIQPLDIIAQLVPVRRDFATMVPDLPYDPNEAGLEDYELGHRNYNIRGSSGFGSTGTERRLALDPTVYDNDQLKAAGHITQGDDNKQEKLEQ